MDFSEREKQLFYLGVLLGAALMPATAIRTAAALGNIWNLSDDETVDDLQAELLRHPDVVEAHNRAVKGEKTDGRLN